jgi:flagellar basal body P-ring formation protein FlgA
VARVVDAVRPHHIIGLDTRGIAEVVVSRASRAITAKDFEARIVRAVAGQNGLVEGQNLALNFDNDVRTIHVEPNGAELRVARLSFEPRTGRFDVSFELPGSVAARRLPLRFTGSLVETYDAIVLARPVAQGEILKASHFTVTRRPKAELATAAAAIDPEQAEGLAARRALRPGQIVRQADLMKAEVVQRNETVTITYEVPGILLSVRGQALEAGARGDLINVLNIQSKKTVAATITGPGRVSVASVAPRLAAQSVEAPSSNSAQSRAE